ARAGVARHYGKCPGAGVYRDGHDVSAECRSAGGVVETNPIEQLRTGGGHRQCGIVFGQFTGAVHYRAGADRGWGDGDAMRQAETVGLRTLNAGKVSVAPRFRVQCSGTNWAKKIIIRGLTHGATSHRHTAKLSNRRISWLRKR